MGTITHRTILGLLLVTGCTSHEAAAPGTGPTAASTPAPTALPNPTPEVEVAQCALQPTPIGRPVLHRHLLAVAPQYFHPPHRGGFDAYRGGGRVFPLSSGTGSSGWILAHRASDIRQPSFG